MVGGLPANPWLLGPEAILSLVVVLCLRRSATIETYMNALLTITCNEAINDDQGTVRTCIEELARTGVRDWSCTV